MSRSLLPGSAALALLALWWAPGCGFEETLLLEDDETAAGGEGGAGQSGGSGSGGVAASGGSGSSTGGMAGAPTGGTGGTSPVAPGARFDHLFLGSWASCALGNQRAVCWGENALGGLGVGDMDPRTTPDEVATVRRFTQLSLQGDHGCGLEVETGAIFCWGVGASGQLGNGQFSDSLIPVQVDLPEPAVQVEAATAHTCAILASRQLWCWGNDAEGQLGQGTNNDQFASPVQVGTDQDWQDVSAHSGHTCGIRGTAAGGAVYCWGRNTNAQIGQGATQPLQHRSPMLVGDQLNWVDVQASQISSCARNSDGELYCWGEDVEGNLGVPGEFLLVPTRVGIRVWQSFALGTFHTCAIGDGELWCWGRNEGGQLGQGTTTDTEPEVRLGEHSDWLSVDVGRFHTCGLRRDVAGSVPTAWCTGNNGRGQLGVGDQDNRSELSAVASRE